VNLARRNLKTLSSRTQAEIVKEAIAVGISLVSSCVAFILEQQSGLARSGGHRNSGDGSLPVVSI
jgi:hypothetical protein